MRDLLQKLRRAQQRLRRAATPLIIGVVVGSALVMVPAIASAAAPPGEEVPISPDTGVDVLLSLTPFTVSLIGGAIVPYVVAFLTKQETATWVKRTLNALGAAITGLLVTTATADGGAIITEKALQSAFLAFLAAAGWYTGIVRNSNTEKKLQEAGPAIGPEGD